MAHPKRKTSIERKKKRRTHDKVPKQNLQHLVICPVTGVSHPPHRAYWHENKLYYRGKPVMEKTPITATT